MHLWMTRGDICIMFMIIDTKQTHKENQNDWRMTWISPSIWSSEGTSQLLFPRHFLLWWVSWILTKVCAYRMLFISLGGRISTQWWSIRLWAIRVNTTASDVNLWVIVAICPSKRKRFLKQWHWHHRKTSGFCFCPRPLHPIKCSSIYALHTICLYSTAYTTCVYYNGLGHYLSGSHLRIYIW